MIKMMISSGKCNEFSSSAPWEGRSCVRSLVGLQEVVRLPVSILRLGIAWSRQANFGDESPDEVCEGINRMRCEIKGLVAAKSLPGRVSGGDSTDGVVFNSLWLSLDRLIRGSRWLQIKFFLILQIKLKTESKSTISLKVFNRSCNPSVLQKVLGISYIIISASIKMEPATIQSSQASEARRLGLLMESRKLIRNLNEMYLISIRFDFSWR